MRILICPNAFKGSLTAATAATAMAQGLAVARLSAANARERSVSDNVTWELLPLADGGDGTLETLTAATDGEIFTQVVSGPLGETVAARWGRCGNDLQGVAVIEMAEASGLRLLREDARDPRRASTLGTGQLMRAAVEAGCRTLLVGIGGSATNDGGMGMAMAMGARFTDAAGRELAEGGAALARLAHIDCSGWALPADIIVRVACDVDNPLCGPEGASAIYGPQKGATPAMVQELDAALAHFATVVRKDLNADVRDVPGAGAAGGLGAGLLAFCRARLEPGTDLILDITGFEARLEACDLVLTGEGRLDLQTTRGKVIAGVVRRARAAGKPVIALAGRVEPGAEAALQAEGLTAAFSIVPGPMTTEDAMTQGEILLAQAAERLLRVVVAGKTYIQK